MRRFLFRLLLAVSTLAATLAAGGCVSLQPLAAVQARLPAGELLDVGGQAVHVEQAGRGEPVVLLHGFGESTYSFRRIVAPLAARYRTIAIDLNGFGYTARPRDPAAYTLEGQQRLVLAVLDRLGVPSAHLVGHSYGGGLALWMAAHHPERVRSLALLDSTLPRYSTTRRSRVANLRPLSFVFLRTFALRQGYVRRSLAKAYRDEALATPEVTRAYLDRLRVAGIDDAYYGLTARNGEPIAEVDLAGIHAAALLVWGRDDTLTPLRNGQRMAAALAGSHLVVLPDCGHVPMEERPAELLAVLLPFLDLQSWPTP
ncbi:MAG TPA: alpha/beta hydrolase [Thermoanaerobaculia bacterium]|jgi:pimeloyl-ACP methyl ester carboxylesterase|nr:alpha/beta hydrolase [Thermoanaerobaculia bacterium]